MLFRPNTRISITRGKYQDAYGLPQNSSIAVPLKTHVPASINQTAELVNDEANESPITVYFAQLIVNGNVDVKRNDIVLDELTGLKWKVTEVTQSVVNLPIPTGKVVKVRREV